MSEYSEFSLDVSVGLLATQINGAIPHSMVEKFKEGLSSAKRINPLYFAKGIVKLCADEPLQAYHMGCYARLYMGSDSQILLELLF